MPGYGLEKMIFIRHNMNKYIHNTAEDEVVKNSELLDDIIIFIYKQSEG